MTAPKPEIDVIIVNWNGGELLQQALRIKIEVAAKERQFLQSALERGGQVDVVRKYKYSVAVSDEHLYWPYEGEFWRDELGTYAYTLTKGCKEGPTASGTIAARSARSSSTPETSR